MAIPLIAYQVRDRNTNETKALNHIKEPKRKREISDSVILSFTSLDRPNNLGYSMLENENYIICDGHEYRIKQVSKRPSYKNVTCVHVFSDLIGVQRYDHLVGSRTLQECLNYLLAGTGWTFTVNPSTMLDIPVVFGEDQWGKGNVVKLLRELCNNVFQLEFEILPNKMLSFALQLSEDKGNKYEYGVNVKTIGEEFDSTSLRTKIRGTYEIVIGQDEDGNDITEERNVTYVSPMAAVYGEIEADPISDSSVQSDSEMMSILAEKLEDTVKYSLDIDAVDFAAKELGETVTINHEGMGLVNSKARILKIEDGLMYVDGEYKMVPTIITLGNHIFGTFRTKVKNRIDKLEDEINKLKKKTLGLWLSTLKIGKVNCLALPGVLLAPQAPNTPIDLEMIVAEVKFKKLEELVGLFITPKASIKDYYIDINTYNKEKNVTGTFNYTDSKTSLETKKFPTADTSYVVVTTMEKPPNEFVEGKHQKQVYGVKFAIDGPINEYLSEFRMGDVECLALGDISIPRQTMVDFIKSPNTKYVLPSVVYQTGTSLDGPVVSLKEEYKNYYLTMLDTYEWNGKMYTDWYEVDPSYGASTGGITIIVTDVPFNNLINNPILTDTAIIAAFGVKFELIKINGLITFKYMDESGKILQIKEQKEEYPNSFYFSGTPSLEGYVPVDPYAGFAIELTPESPTAIIEYIYKKDITKETWLSEFKIGGIDCLPLNGVKLSSGSSRPANSVITAEFQFNQYNSLTGLSVKLKPEYSSFYVYFGEYYNDGDYYENLISGKNTNNYIFPWREDPYWMVSAFVRILEVPKASFNPSIHKSQAFGVKFVKAQNKGYTLEFATAKLANEIVFEFENENGYDKVESIVTSITSINAVTNIDLVGTPYRDPVTTKAMGIRVLASGSVANYPNAMVSVQAVCYNEVT